MTDQERGAYTPQTDAPLAFDARAPRGARRPLPMALIGGVVVLLVLVVAVVMYYRSGVRGGGAQVAVGEPVGAVKTAPAASEKNEDPFSNLDVYAAQNVPSAPASAAPAPAFAPPPEQPQPRPAAQAGLKVQTVETAPIRAVPPASAPGAAPPPARLAPVPAAPPATVAATPAKPPAAVAAAKPAAAPATPAAPPAIRTTTAAAAPAPAAPTAPAPAPAGAGPSVQIGAYSSAGLADKGYGEVTAAFPGFTVGKGKRVEPLERDGKTLYRTSITGFASRSAAQAFCEALKAAKRVCLVKG